MLYDMYLLPPAEERHGEALPRGFAGGALA